MKEKFVLVSGSASYSCPEDLLSTAIDFVRRFTSEVLRHGGGLVVLAGNEENARDRRGLPHIFDWVVIREIKRHVSNTLEDSRVCLRVVMSDEARKLKIDSDNLRLIRNLEQRKSCESFYVPSEKFTGGAYRTKQTDIADAMLAIGGGKGTYSIGMDMISLGKPILPMDIPIGAIIEDGDGAVALYKCMMSNPERFFPNTHLDVKNSIGMISLINSVNNVDSTAQVAAGLLARELNATKTKHRRMKGVRNQLYSRLKLIRSLPVIASGVKLFEFIKGLFILT